MEELHRSVGIARIGVLPDVAPFDWTYHKRHSGIRRADAQHLERRAKEWGSHPEEWRLTFTSVPRSAWVRVEVWNGEEWRPHPVWRGRE
jgi:hypothetical protein